MNTKHGKTTICVSFVLVASLSLAWRIQAQNAPAQNVKSPYPSRASIEQYRMDRDTEIALARTAAPASISRDAEVLVLGQKNYETAVQGTNGFVCFVARSWLAPFYMPEFWNPKIRGPLCYNPPAVKSVLPLALKMTRMVLAGFSKTQMSDGIKAAVDKKELSAPASGSMSYMLSKEAYITDAGHHNFCHLMFELPRMDGTAWGASDAHPGAPILFQDSPIAFLQWDPAPMTEFYAAMGEWSDGTAVTTPHTH